jgi:hypothetical protein
MDIGAPLLPTCQPAAILADVLSGQRADDFLFPSYCQENRQSPFFHARGIAGAKAIL